MTDTCSRPDTVLGELLVSVSGNSVSCVAALRSQESPENAVVLRSGLEALPARRRHFDGRRVMRPLVDFADKEAIVAALGDESSCLTSEASPSFGAGFG